ncbi:hypothetical protein M409DRAFT_27005 [Zasmidium cellare ATCC 36951]|uniref:Enoyl reductase (ER) domain-containing protein n=1 Tax=Zasmidium cellare ATCC 36951 TaxID=1080233 RepID=A0A6A6CBC6_ZASCE|nr:uncharacterized protein M409DRAFT_27005 [Zasmidium cellare ATCC 36951]KAF2162766.1 hypothetical protein M409DRAFT_27005 [Zasmidium cellare ATCC 36951]
MAQPTTRRAGRRTDDHTPGTPKVKIVEEKIQYPLETLSVLIAVKAVSLNYRDANIANGGNPWPVTPNGILCNDAAGEVIAIGSGVTEFQVGDRAAPINDTENLTGREVKRSWLAADEDGVLADYIVFDQRKLTRLPEYLPWEEACIVPCAGVTAWSALKGLSIGQSVLIQGTGGVAMFGLKLARAAGYRVIVSSSSDKKLQSLVQKFPGNEPILTVNYASNPNWHEEVLRLTDGVGVDFVLENGGQQTIVKSLRCTRRGGTVSVVGYLSERQGWAELEGLLPTLIDRRVNLRGINCGSRMDQQDLVAALEATKIRFDDIIDSTYALDDADEALQYLWEGKQVGKIVIKI